MSETDPPDRERPESRPWRDAHAGARPDGEAPVSTLYLFLQDETPPQPVEVVSRLSAAGFDPTDEPAERSGDDQEEEGVAWKCWVTVRGSTQPYLLVLIPRDEEFSPWEWACARWSSDEEYRSACASRWVLVVETPMEPAHPHESYHRQLRVAAAIADGLAVACYDENSTLLRSWTTLRELASCEVPPAPEELYEVHCVGESDAAWVHTHGLRRFDLPDLEVLGLDGDRYSLARTAVTWLTAYLLGEDVPSEGCQVEFGDGLNVELLPLDELTEVRENRLPLGTLAERDEMHLGWRMAICDLPECASSLAPRKLLAALEGDPVFWLSSAESSRRASLAQARFPLAAMAYFSSRYREKEFLVKVAIPTGDDLPDDPLALLRDPSYSPDGNCEHMWFQVNRLEKSLVHGVLTNEPVFARYVERGQEYVLSMNLISHFEIFIDGHTYSPENISELDLVTLHTTWEDDDEEGEGGDRGDGGDSGGGGSEDGGPGDGNSGDGGVGDGGVGGEGVDPAAARGGVPRADDETS